MTHRTRTRNQQRENVCKADCKWICFWRLMYFTWKQIYFPVFSSTEPTQINAATMNSFEFFSSNKWAICLQFKLELIDAKNIYVNIFIEYSSLFVFHKLWAPDEHPIKMPISIRIGISWVETMKQKCKLWITVNNGKQLLIKCVTSIVDFD